MLERKLPIRTLVAVLAVFLLPALAGKSGAARAAGAVVAWGNPGGPEAAVPPGLSNVVAISAGTFNSLALRDDGTLVLWGSNYFDPVSPTNVPPSATNISAIAVGYGHNLALRRDGQVIAWGAGTLNATGLIDYAQSVVPADLTNAMAIAAGGDISLALRSNGTVAAWGVLTNVPPGLSNVTAIAAGRGTHALALRADGTVAVWRQDYSYDPDITNVPAGLSNVVAIAAGDAFSLALRSDGTVAGWGYGTYGQLDIPPGLTNVISIACGEFHALAIRQDHTVVAWGAGGSGSNSWPNIGQAVVPFGLTNASAVSGGYFCSLALYGGSPVLTVPLASQTNYTGTTITFTAAVQGLPPLALQWQHSGTNLPGATNLTLVLPGVQLADAGGYRLIASNPYGTLASPEAALVLTTSLPIILQPPGSVASLMTSNCTLSVTATGSLPISYQWRGHGTNLAGATSASLTLTNLQIADGGSYDVVLANDYGSVTSSIATLAVTPSFVVGWGNGGFGRTNHPPALTNVIAVAAGYSHSLALQENGVVVAWGGNGSGQTNVPADLTNATAIAAGADFCVALKSDGHAVAWGDNAFTQTNVPPTLSNVVAIAAGDYHTLALKRDGTLAGWGYFVVFDRTIRVPFWIPAGISNVIAVATGPEYGLALKTNGSVIAWGYNFTPGLTNVPPGVTNVVAIAAGSQHCLALRRDGTAAAWGNNSYGQTNVPAGLTNVVAIAAGSYHNVALRGDGTVVTWGAGTNTGSYPMFGQARVPGGLGNVVGIAAGDTHTLALRDLRPPSLYVAQPAKTNATFNLTVPSFNNRVYALEFKGSLAQTSWSRAALAAGIGDALRLSDAGATNSQRFYRVRQW